MKKNFFWMTMDIYHMSFKLYPSWCFIDSTHLSEPFIIKKGRNVFIPRQMKMFFFIFNILCTSLCTSHCKVNLTKQKEKLPLRDIFHRDKRLEIWGSM